jgi:methionyl-tRNA formyltransferase
MDGIEDGVLEPRPQPADGVTIAAKLTSDDVRVDWTLPDVAIDRLVRAATPAPGAWTTFRGARVKLAPVRPAAGAVQTPLPAGRLVAVGKDGVAVGTGTTAVLLGEVRPEGKAPMPAAAWLRGLRLTDGEAFA